MIVIIATTTSCVDLKINTFACREREGEEKQRDSKRVAHHFLSHPLLHTSLGCCCWADNTTPIHYLLRIETASQFQSVSARAREIFVYQLLRERRKRERE